jgi:hypothetical protein
MIFTAQTGSVTQTFGTILTPLLCPVYYGRMTIEFEDPEDISPYDLDAIGREMERERGVEKALRAAAHIEVRRRIERLKAMGDLNAYDIGQMAHIFEPINALDRRHHF